MSELLPLISLRPTEYAILTSNMSPRGTRDGFSRSQARASRMTGTITRTAITSSTSTTSLAKTRVGTSRFPSSRNLTKSLMIVHRNRYLILDVLGQGTFGQVVKCQNLKTQEVVAVKVVKNKTAYFNQSMMEVSVLDLVRVVDALGMQPLTVVAERETRQARRPPFASLKGHFHPPAASVPHV